VPSPHAFAFVNRLPVIVPRMSGATREQAQQSLDALAGENALLRASLAEMQARLGELEDANERDPVTGLPTRQRFLREVERVVGLVDRHGTQAALLHIDLNGLRAINERHGRIAGDAALIHVARLLSRLIRTTDILGRMRGDEFGLILDHLDHNSAIETSERLARCIAESPLDLGGHLVPVAATIGVATILPGDSAKDVLRRAGKNMSRAKDEA
jgi:diguanylate cyclase (GGDEF)-like protein